MDNGTWAIEARAFLIKPFPLAHQFWVLMDSDGNIAGQIHGLAVDPITGDTKAVGHAGHLLQAIFFENLEWPLQPNQPSLRCISSEKDIVMARWMASLRALPAINNLQLRYPNLWQHTRRPNSNSIFSLVATIMDFDVPDRLPPSNAFAPGLRIQISQEIIEQYRFV